MAGDLRTDDPSRRSRPLVAKRRIALFEPRHGPKPSFPAGWSLKTGLLAWAKDAWIHLPAVALIAVPWAAAAWSVSPDYEARRGPWFDAPPRSNRLLVCALLAVLPLANGLLASLSASFALRRVDAPASLPATLFRAVRATLPCALALCAEYWIGTMYLVMGILGAAAGHFDATLALWTAFAVLFLGEAAIVTAAPIVAEGLGPRRGRRRVQELWAGVGRRRGGLMILPLAAYVLVLTAGVVAGRRVLGSVAHLPFVGALGFLTASLDAAIGAAAYVHRRGVVDGAPASALAAVFE